MGLIILNNLILPGDPEYDFTLSTVVSPDWQILADQWNGDYGFVVDPETGLMRVEDSKGITEYLYGGEYDERLEQIDELD